MLSDSSVSVSSDGSSDADSTSSVVADSFDIDKLEKKADGFGANRTISPLWAFIFFVFASAGGFQIGRYVSSTRLSPRGQPLDAHIPSQQDFRENLLPFMASYWAYWDEPRAIRQPSIRQAEGKEMAHRKRFAAHVIHPAMLTVSPAPTSIAIAVDRYPKANSATGIELAGDLLSEIVKYKDLNHITVIFADEGNTNYAADLLECPDSLLNVLALAGKEGVDMKCSNTSANNVGVHPISRHHDVSVVLANCDGEELNGDSTWEEELYLSTKSIAIKCVGKSYPLDHPARYHKGVNSGESINIKKIEHFFVPNLRLNPSADSFLHATDYDIFDQRGVATNLAVAFRSIKNGLHQWNLSEAQYQVAIHQRWESFASEENESLLFGSADMLRIQFPSPQSAASSCQYYKHLISDVEGDVEMICEQGLLQVPNIPVDKFYVAKSTVSESAGRGIFPSVDLISPTYVMAEKYSHDVYISSWGFSVIERMTDAFCLPNKENTNNRFDNFHCIVGIYYDSYGYMSDGIPGAVAAVDSGISTFVNHGCNGTASVDDVAGDPTEFTMLPGEEGPNPETFEIPSIFHMILYNPNYARQGHLGRYDLVEEQDVPAHKEILDNYVPFGGEKYFLSNIATLKSQCSGATGTVVHYENEIPGEHKYDNLGSPYILDIDVVRQKQLSYYRRIGHNESS